MHENLWGMTCNNITCHGGNNATWGVTPTCDGCHGGGADVDNWDTNDGTNTILDDNVILRNSVGIVLTGAEVKSARAGKVQLVDSYAAVKNKVAGQNTAWVQYTETFAAGRHRHPRRGQDGQRV